MKLNPGDVEVRVEERSEYKLLQRQSQKLTHFLSYYNYVRTDLHQTAWWGLGQERANQAQLIVDNAAPGTSLSPRTPEEILGEETFLVDYCTFCHPLSDSMPGTSLEHLHKVYH
jgi:hypothetical protein